jgi:hypothetical protein
VRFFSNPFGAWLLRRFGPKIFVSITDASVELRSASSILALQPVLFVKDDIIVAVGTPPKEPCDSLAVFTSDPGQRSQRFSKLAGYGVTTMIGKSIRIKPVVTVSLRTTRISSEEVRGAFLLAGAGEVFVT